MNNKVEFNEVVELFISYIIYEIKNESEIPRFNIVFKKDAYDLFYEIMNSPFKKEGYYTPNIKEEDIITLKDLNVNDLPTIYVKDHIKFFYYLTEITNNLVKLYNNFNETSSGRNLSIQIMKRIWLRMNISDFNNVELFLEKQLNFLKNNLFDYYKKGIVRNDFFKYKVFAQSEVNRTWDESTRSMNFKIYDFIYYHNLPRILYDIIDNTCYIYGIQKDFLDKKIPEIEKIIYKLYRGNGQPNKVLAMKLFIDILKEKDIKTIKVPTLQVLSYRYHELLSKKEKEVFYKKWTTERIDNFKNLSGGILNYELLEYQTDKKWYQNLVDNEDTISKLKTEDFINLIYRIIDEDDDLILENDIFTSDELIIKIKNKRLII